MNLQLDTNLHSQPLPIVKTSLSLREIGDLVIHNRDFAETVAAEVFTSWRKEKILLDENSTRIPFVTEKGFFEYQPIHVEGVNVTKNDFFHLPKDLFKAAITTVNKDLNAIYKILEAREQQCINIPIELSLEEKKIFYRRGVDKSIPALERKLNEAIFNSSSVLETLNRNLLAQSIVNQ